MVLDFASNYEIKQLLAYALNEDIREGDHSSLSSIPWDREDRAKLLVKEEGILAGVALAQEIIQMVDPSLHLEVLKQDGTKITHGDIAFYLSGRTHSILKCERLILNFMQRLSGIATITNTYVNAIKDTPCKLLDTRKTTPGLRLLEKWAVALGGGNNHRVGLYDMIMLKDNHIDAAGGLTKALTLANAYRKATNPKLKIEVETRSLDEVQEALASGVADRIMLDNFTLEKTREAIAMISNQVETESSGGITLSTLHDYAKTGITYISVGALTHSVKALDLSLKIIKQ
ncbi:MAG: carboxylating nicotinate-nucleotide diphosphorylase [Bacteroidetes bacterium]|nr:carboxylating nicotinate-nucleotide diphosphorylase [Bacteroidota bacterium]